METRWPMASSRSPAVRTRSTESLRRRTASADGMSQVAIEGDLVCGGATSGLFARVAEVSDVMKLLDSDQDDLVIYMGESSVTLVTPVLELAVAVVCPGGGAGGHVELVARELGIACICSAREIGA